MTNIQPHHTYHEYIQAMQLANTMRIRAKRYKLSDNDQKELTLLEDRLKVSGKIYNNFFNR